MNLAFRRMPSQLPWLAGAAGLVLGFGATAGLEWLGSEAVLAAPAPAPTPILFPWNSDADADGLDDTYELVLGTDPTVADTDGDGYFDLIEFVAQSDPHFAGSVPAARSASRSVVYQKDAWTMRFAFLVYEPSGLSQNVTDRWGLIYRDGWEDASGVLHAVRTERTFAHLGQNVNGKVFEVGYNVPLGLLSSQDPNYLGWHFYFSAGWGSNVLSGVFNLRKVQGMLVETLYFPQWLGSGTGGGNPPLSAAFASFRPFDVQTAETQAWQRNRACFLYLSTTPYQQRETGLAWFPVQNAFCEPSSFAYCAPGCNQSAWSLQNNQAVRVLDPFALAGL